MKAIDDLNFRDDHIPFDISDIGIPYYTTDLGAAFLGDSLEYMKKIKSDSVNLVMTSPPFALIKKKAYGNVDAPDYLEWIKPFATEIFRILRDDGSFVIDLGGTWVKGQPTRSLYHFELVMMMVKEIGFHLAQDFYWYNPSKLPTPAEWVTIRRIRVKDAVNTVWWFSKTPFPNADNRRVLKPYSDSMEQLLERGYKAKMRPSGHNISTKFRTRNEGAIPPNFLEIANTESNSRYLRGCKELGIKPHPARFPTALPEFFVKFLTEEGHVVLDPFAGSNSTGEVSENLGRRWVAFELEQEYLDGSKLRFERLND
ncbi:methyltransferase [Alicyclobacillus acidoterrestris]|nr:methyltransferase [Alicyclobacillus acidoterrestris]